MGSKLFLSVESAQQSEAVFLATGAFTRLRELSGNDGARMITLNTMSGISALEITLNQHRKQDAEKGNFSSAIEISLSCGAEMLDMLHNTSATAGLNPSAILDTPWGSKFGIALPNHIVLAFASHEA